MFLLYFSEVISNKYILWEDYLFHQMTPIYRNKSLR